MFILEFQQLVQYGQLKKSVVTNPVAVLSGATPKAEKMAFSAQRNSQPLHSPVN